MHRKRRLLEGVLVAYREGDLDECIRRVGTLVEAAPDVAAPRYLLASLYAHAGQGRLALVHYRKLLAPAAARGELFRSIAIQKQIDSFQAPETLDPDRWVRLQRHLRSQGLPYFVAAPGGSGKPWVEAQFLALPRPWFERVAEETRVEVLDARVVEVEAGTVWEVLAGRLRWSFALPDGRASSEVVAAEGDAITVDTDIARRAQLTFIPELPAECLRFDAALTRDLRVTFASLGLVGGASVGGITPEARALLPSRPRQRADLDVTPPVPAPVEGAEPPRLLPGAPVGAGADPSREDADWLEFGVLSLGDPEAGAEDGPAADPGEPATLDLSGAQGTPPPAAPGSHDGASGGSPGERVVELPSVGARPPARRGRPVVERPGPVEMGDGLIIPPSVDPFAAPIPDLGKPIERRRHSRVAVSFESRKALLRLRGTGVEPIPGELIDLSTSGLGMRFAKRALWSVREALADAVVTVDLDMPTPEGPLRVAAQVRWLEIDEQGDEARLGIEFVLMTEPDRRRIAGALAGAPLAAGEATGEAR